MQNTELMTAGEVAAHCRVSYEAVKEWVNKGKLKASFTPGGHRRIAADDFREFLRQYDWPPLPQDEGAKHRVLIVDDDPEVVKLLTKFFGKAGDYELATAPDGYAAGFQVATFCPEVVLLDLMMPHLDGFEVCRQIKSAPRTRHTYVLVMTGTPTDEHRQQALDCGADGFLAKPFKLAELRKHIETVFQQAGRVAARSAS